MKIKRKILKKMRLGSSWEVPNFYMLAKLGSSWEVGGDLKTEPELAHLPNGEKNKGAALSPPLPLVNVAFGFGIVGYNPTANELIKKKLPPIGIVPKASYAALIDSIISNVA